MHNPDVRLIKLSNGNTLEVSMFPGFLDKLREHFSLESTDDVQDEHIRMYIYGAFKGAIDKQEYDKI